MRLLTCVALVAALALARARRQDSYGLASNAFNRTCVPLSSAQRSLLLEEASHYTQTRKYLVKIAEANGERALGSQHVAIMGFLEQHVLLPGQSVLDLGCAAGAMLRHVAESLRKSGPVTGNFTGVELVGGWVEAARRAFPKHAPPEVGGRATFVHADITDVHLGVPIPTYDMIMLNDVLEHVMPSRFPCLMTVFARHTKPGGAVYLHVPTPLTQIDEGKKQYFENVVPVKAVVAGFAAHGFELERFELDVTTDCGRSLPAGTPVEKLTTPAARVARCLNKRGSPKYSHYVFRRAAASTPAARGALDETSQPQRTRKKRAAQKHEGRPARA